MARKRNYGGGDEAYNGVEEQQESEDREAQVTQLGAAPAAEEPEPPKTPYDGWSDEMKQEAEAFGNKCIEIFNKLTPEMVGLLSRFVSAVQGGIAEPILLLQSLGVPLEFPPKEEEASA